MSEMSERPRASVILEKVYGKWWMMLLEGLGLIILSGVMLFWPDVSLTIIVMAMGILRGIMGVFYIIIGIAGRKTYGIRGITARGVLDLIIGAIFLLTPTLIVGMFTLMMGILLILIGFGVVSFAWQIRTGMWVPTLILGILIIGFGCCAFANPAWLATIFLIILAIILTVIGVLTIIKGFGLHRVIKSVKKEEKGFTDYHVES